MRRLPLVLWCTLALPSLANAQQTETAESRLKVQRDELLRIREERDALEKKMSGLQNTAHELADEVNLLD